MAKKPTSLQTSELQAASGATRNEILSWRAFLRYPLANEAPGKAMRYSLINGIEFTLLKLCVSRGVPHEIAAEFIGKRLDLAIRAADHARLAIATSVISHPAEWLAGSEFDCIDVKRSMVGQPMDAHSFWAFDPQNGFRSSSLYDVYLRTVEWGPRHAKYRADRGLAPVDFDEDPLRAVERGVYAEVSRGSIVVEILGPLRRFYALAFGTMFIPGDPRVPGEREEA